MSAELRTVSVKLFIKSGRGVLKKKSTNLYVAGQKYQAVNSAPGGGWELLGPECYKSDATATLGVRGRFEMADVRVSTQQFRYSLTKRACSDSVDDPNRSHLRKKCIIQ